MKKIILFCILSVVVKSYSQDLEKHQWKDRLLLIFSDDSTSDKMQKQIDILSKEKEGLANRKLFIYRFSENGFTTDFNTVWFSSTLKTGKYKRKSEDFKIVLVGLDGGVKLKQTAILSTEKLFTIIDGMPMRRVELKAKNKQ